MSLRYSFRLNKTHPGDGVAVTDECHGVYIGRSSTRTCRCGMQCAVCGGPKHCSLHMPADGDTSGRPWDHEYTPARNDQ